MSAFDTFVRDHVAYPILPILFIILIFYLGKNYIDLLRKRTFAIFLEVLGSIYNKSTDDIKRKLFNPLNDIVSQDWKLKNEGRIRILEFGIGTGANLKYFPKTCQLVALDPNEQVKAKFNDNCKKHHIEVENFIVGGAEDMSEIKDNSVDAVVCTLVFCSVKNPMKILQEIKRVLVPGGKFFFLEHVHADDGTFLNKLQSILTVTKLWPALFLGCQLNRHTGETIGKAGFSKVDLRKIEIKIDKYLIFKVIKSHICGMAEK